MISHVSSPLDCVSLGFVSLRLERSSLFMNQLFDKKLGLAMRHCYGRRCLGGILATTRGYSKPRPAPTGGK